MADRFFPNEMPSFLEESAEQAEAARKAGERLLYRLRLPYPKFIDSVLLHGGLHVVQRALSEDLTNGDPEFVQDYTFATGRLGVAYLLLKSFLVKYSRSDLQLPDSRSDLEQCLRITTACYHESLSEEGFEPTWDGDDICFIWGRAGVCAIGAVAAMYLGDEVSMTHFISAFRSIRVPTSGSPSVIFQGRAGYLWTCLFLNKHLGCHTVSSSDMCSIANQLILEGRSNPDRGDIPLMYKHCGKNFYGASRGVAGILHVLMDMHLNKEEENYVKGTLKYMIQHRLPSGNYRETKQSLDEDDVMVHWCHGAPGIALTLIKAFQVFKDQEFLTAAEDAAQVVWNRGLLKRVGLCHGVSGNAYVFLALYRATGRIEYLFKAKAFASFLFTKAQELFQNKMMYHGDHPVSLFEGVGGIGCLFLDMVNPMESRFPGYEL